MENFLSKWISVKSNRKSLYFSAFILICFFVVLPIHPAHAWPDIAADIQSRLVSWIGIVVYRIMEIILEFATLLVYFGAWMVDVMLNPLMYRSILVGTPAADGTTVTGAVELGWRTVRDFCNMFYVFFLLLIAFATITGNQTYSAKSLLPKFIISIFLINFSATIAKMVIDVGQVFLFGMAAWLGTFSGSEGSGAALTGIVNYFKMELSGLENPSFSDIVMIIFAVAYTFVLAIIYVMLAAFLLIRLIMFAILIIISPFAFFSMVLPSMRKYTSQWWGQLISNTISGPVFVFFVYISAMMAKNLTDNPVSTDVSTLGDTSKMSYMTPVLIAVIPHVVAMGMLLFAVIGAKSVGAAGQNYIIGGRAGIGKMAGMGYAGFKLGERSTRRAASGVLRGANGALKGFNWAKDRGVERFASVSNVQDKFHGKYQEHIAKVPFVGTNLALRDEGAVQAAKKKAMDDRLKSWGGNLKAINIDLALKGDNISKALALKAAAEQGKLGDMDDKGNFKYAKYFGDAEAVMARGDIKDLTSRNLAFNTLTSENQAKIKNKDVSSFDAEAQKRIAKAQLLGLTPERAISDEIMRSKAMGVIADGEDNKVQGLDNADVARVMMNAYTPGQLADATKKMNKDRKMKFKTGLTTNIVNLETARQLPANAANASKIYDEKMKFAFTAIKSGANLDDALAKAKTGAKYNDHVKELLKGMDASTIASMDTEDLKAEGHHFDVKQLHSLNKRREDVTLNHIEEAVKAMPTGPDKTAREDAFKSFIK